MPEVNYLAVLAAGIASMIIGYVWYGPLFGKQWMKASGVSAADVEAGKKDMPKTYGLMYISSVVMAYVLSVFIYYAGVTSMIEGAMIGFWAWLGFVATVMLGGVLFERRPVNLFYLNAGYNLVTLVVMGAVLVMMGASAY